MILCAHHPARARQTHWRHCRSKSEPNKSQHCLPHNFRALLPGQRAVVGRVRQAQRSKAQMMLAADTSPLSQFHKIEHCTDVLLSVLSASKTGTESVSWTAALSLTPRTRVCEGTAAQRCGPHRHSWTLSNSRLESDWPQLPGQRQLQCILGVLPPSGVPDAEGSQEGLACSHQPLPAPPATEAPVAECRSAHGSIRTASSRSYRTARAALCREAQPCNLVNDRCRTVDTEHHASVALFKMVSESTR